MREDLGELACRLAECRSFVEIGCAICRDAPALCGLEHCAISLNAVDGAPRICVDNAPQTSDEQALAYFELWEAVDGERFRALRRRHLPSELGDAELDDLRACGFAFTPGVYVIDFPLLAMNEMVGVFRSSALVPFSDDQLRKLGTLTVHISVRLAQLDHTPLPPLTARQLEVARLGAHGFTNLEIADRLGITQNTVKKHLKDAYDVLEIAGRADLGALRARLDVNDPILARVTRIGDVRVTRR